VGRRLAAAIHDAWAHLDHAIAPPGPDELRIDLWDERETGVPRDPAHDPIQLDGRFPYQVSPDDGLVGHRLPQLLTWLDRREGRAVGSVGDASLLTGYARARPVETPLLFWLRDRGVPLVHAGLVSRDEEGVLLLGRSGAGKSTAALACVGAGFDFLGDDKTALLRDADGAYVGWSLTSAAQLEPHQLDRFPTLAPHAVPDPDPEGKAVVLLSRLGSANLRARVRLRALAVLRITRDAPPPPAPAPPRDALVAAGLSTVLQLPIDRTRSLGVLADLVARVPAYWLDLGPDLEDIPRRVTRILADVRTRVGAPDTGPGDRARAARAE
jgi:hypothetical protein